MTRDTLCLTTSVISSPHFPFLLNAEDTKGMGTNQSEDVPAVTVRTNYGFEAAVSSHEQTFMEMSLPSFAAVPVY